MAAVPPNYAVTCHTCTLTLWSSNDYPGDGHDGQAIATKFADKTCPRNDCPHKTAAVTERRKQRPVVVGDLESILARLAALEARPK
jgi:hypothetical protein